MLKCQFHEIILPFWGQSQEFYVIQYFLKKIGFPDECSLIQTSHPAYATLNTFLLEFYLQRLHNLRLIMFHP